MNCVGFTAMKNRTISIHKTTMNQRVIGLRWDISNPCSFPLCNHSTTNIMTMNKFVGHISGKVKKQ